MIIDKEGLALWDGTDSWDRLLDVVRKTKTWPVPGLRTGYRIFDIDDEGDKTDVEDEESGEEDDDPEEAQQGDY